MGSLAFYLHRWPRGHVESSKTILRTAFLSQGLRFLSCSASEKSHSGASASVVGHKRTRAALHKRLHHTLLSNAGFVRSMFKGVIKCNCGLKLSLEISTYIILATEATNQQEAQLKSISSSAKS